MHLSSNRLLAVLMFAVTSISCGSGKKNTVAANDTASQPKATFKNPLPVRIGDPYVLHDTGIRYYMYGTGGGARDGFPAYSSNDLVNWKHEGQVTGS